MIYTDRSRIERYRRCPRAYYWEYKHDGIGVVPRALDVEMARGGFIHIGLAELLRGRTPDAAVVAALRAYDEAVVERGFSEVLLDYLAYTIDEQRSLIEAAIRAWAFERLPKYREVYAIDGAHVEKEMRLRLAGETSNVELMGRADDVLTHKENGLNYVLSFKTKGSMDRRQKDGARTDLQGLTEPLLAERAFGIPVFGTVMEYIVVGNRRTDRRDDEEEPDFKALKKQDSHLVYAWKHKELDEIYAWKFRAKKWSDVKGDFEVKSLSYKQWEKVPVWQEPMGMQGWIRLLMDRKAWPEWENPFQKIFICPDPIWRPQREVEEALQDILAQEQEIAAKQEKEAYPKYTHSCQYPRRCAFYGLCWQGQDDDVYGSGFVKRTPNHPAEIEISMNREGDKNGNGYPQVY